MYQKKAFNRREQDHAMGLRRKLAWRTTRNKNAPAVSRSKMDQFSAMSR